MTSNARAERRFDKTDFIYLGFERTRKAMQLLGA